MVSICINTNFFIHSVCFCVYFLLEKNETMSRKRIRGKSRKGSLLVSCCSDHVDDDDRITMMAWLCLSALLPLTSTSSTRVSYIVIQLYICISYLFLLKEFSFGVPHQRKKGEWTSPEPDQQASEWTLEFDRSEIFPLAKFSWLFSLTSPSRKRV